MELRDALMPGVFSLLHGCGNGLPGPRLAVASLRPGANLNSLLGAGGRDPLSGNAVFNGAAVRLAPARTLAARGLCAQSPGGCWCMRAVVACSSIAGWRPRPKTRHVRPDDRSRL